MPLDIKEIGLSIFAILATACSNTPAVRTAAAPQTFAAAGNTSAVSPGTAPAAPAVAASEVDATLVKAGYSVMKRHGEVLYCRTEVITGQRIGTRICLTAAQIQGEQQNATKARDLLNQPAYYCSGASCHN